MKQLKLVVFFIALLFASSLFGQQAVKPVCVLKGPIITGAEQTGKYLPLIGKSPVAIVANQTSVIRGKHLVDTLKSSGVNIRKVFAPEHGFRGQSGAGEKIANEKDPKTGIQIVSLYGKKLKPSSEDLKGIKYVIFDIQDVGVRFYTYISTLQYIMEACAENDITLIVLDRPNPNGFYIDGPVLDTAYRSFVGMQKVPVVYGMTIGEYAMMLKGEKWIKGAARLKMKMIELENYDHKRHYELSIPPSPNLKTANAIFLYPSICFFEGAKVSLGRGTDKPFEQIGFPGYEKGDVKFTPVNIPGVAMNPPYKDSLCSGLDLRGEGLKLWSGDSQGLSLSWLIMMYKAFPDKDRFFNSFFDKLAGNGELRKQIIEGKSEEEIRDSWKKDLTAFKKIRSKYLLYKD